MYIGQHQSSNCPTSSSDERFHSSTAVKHLNVVGPNEGVDAPSKSVFSNRTDPNEAENYFNYYSKLSTQQLMLEDSVRTGTYQTAILANNDDFHDKVVLDVGAGSGILSFFAIQAGARRVYAVEASSVSNHCEALVAANNLTGRIVVIRLSLVRFWIAFLVKILQIRLSFLSIDSLVTMKTRGGLEQLGLKSGAPISK